MSIKQNIRIKDFIGKMKEIKKRDQEQYGLFTWKNYLSNPWLCVIACILLDILIFVSLRVLFALIAVIVNTLSGVIKNVSNPNRILPDVSFVKSFMTVRIPFIAYLITFIVCIAVDIKLTIKYFILFDDLNIGQEGDGRWTTYEETKKQYPAVPERDGIYTGYGGFPISWDRKEKKIFIDTSAVHNLISGTTRSGKGETLVFCSIDVYSRGTEKPSMIIGDPKVELYKGSYKTLTERGFKCMCLNLGRPSRSVQFNPLDTINALWQKGMALKAAHDITADESFAPAETMVTSFSSSLFSNSAKAAGSSDPFWNDSGSSLLQTLIMQLLIDTNECEKVLEKKLREAWEARKKRWEKQTEKAQHDIMRIMSNMSPYEILFNTNALPPETEFPENELHIYSKQINMYSVAMNYQYLSSHNVTKKDNYLDLFIRIRPLLDKAKNRFTTVASAQDVTKSSIYSTFNSKIQLYSQEPVARMTCRNSFRLLDFGFGNREGKAPIALFYSTPDYDESLYVLASTLIEQLYFVLAKECAENTKDGKCTRKVVFLLDEFGNLPPIAGMESKITVSLGRSIHFDMFVQGFNQLKATYGEDVAETIKGNCGNIVYLLSGDNATNKDFSEMIGNRTVKTATVSGKRFSANKSVTESFKSVPLISPQQLTRLKEGENVVRRIMKRSDIGGSDIEQFPIFNRENQRFKYRYQYLADQFDPQKDDDVPFENAMTFDLEDYRFDIVSYWEAICATTDDLMAKAKEKGIEMDSSNNPEILEMTYQKFVDADLEKRRKKIREAVKARTIQTNEQHKQQKEQAK